jgi:hypothetical protein
LLAIPSAVDCVLGHLGKPKKEWHERAHYVYTTKTRLVCYATTKVLYNLIGLEYVSVGQITNILKSMNALSAREDVENFDGAHLVDLPNITSALKDSASHESRKNLLKELQSAKILTMDEDMRLKCFAADPNYRLASNLEYRVPHSGPFYTKTKNNNATAVPLDSLDDEVDVIMATNFMSQKDYKAIVGEVGVFPVYVDHENMGSRKGGKWSEINVKHTAKASVVKTILDIISKDNKSSLGGAKTGDEELIEAGGVTELQFD